MTLGVRVPDCEEGYLFRDAVVIELIPPEKEDEDWQVKFDWQSDNIGQATKALPAKGTKQWQG